MLKKEIEIKLEEMLNNKKFVADFSDTTTTEKILEISFDTDIEYGNFLNILENFTKKHDLKKFNYVNDLFFSENKNIVYTYIKNNYFSPEGDTLTEEEINSNLYLAGV